MDLNTTIDGTGLAGGVNGTNGTEGEQMLISTLYKTNTFLTSFLLNGGLAAAELLAWIVLRRLIKAVYEPRTYIPPKEEQSSPLGKHLLKPLWKIIMANPEDILEKNGVDPYIFVRFLRLLARALVPIWIVSWIVLFPVNVVNTGEGSTVELEMLARNATTERKVELEYFTFAHIGTDDRERYWAHVCLAWLFNGWIMFLMWIEMRQWLSVRQRYLISTKHSRTAQASTILVTGIPRHCMEEGHLANLFSYLPGGVKRVWLVRDLAELPDLWRRRLHACAVLEKAQVDLIQTAYRNREKALKKIAKYESRRRPVPQSLRKAVNPEAVGPVVDRYVAQKERPTIHLPPKWARGKLSFLAIGKKVDAVEWARKEIALCTKGLNEARGELARDIATPGIGDQHFQPLSSAFIHFNKQIAAHMAHQVLTFHEPYKMNNRFIEQSPENVLWSNTAIKSQYELNLRVLLSYLGTAALIVGFAIPALYASVLGAYLLETWPLLQPDNPKYKDKLWVLVIKGLCTGIAPPVMLAVLLLVAPILLRVLARLYRVSKTEVELNIMNRYFFFLLINRFLVVTIVSLGVNDADIDFKSWAADRDIVDSFRDTLTHQLPKASNFFIILVMVQFTGTLFTLLQPISLVLYYVRVILGGSTPRKAYRSRYSMTYPNWGSEFPSVTIYFAIMMTYMIISPVINGLGAWFSIMSYFVYKYLCLWVWEQKPQMDTGGAFFPKAVTHVFVGLYLQEIVLAALFFTKMSGRDKTPEAIPQAVLMLLLILVTMAVHYMLWASYNPLVDSLPLSLAHLLHGANSDTDDKEKKEKRLSVRRHPAVDPGKPTIVADTLTATPAVSRRPSCELLECEKPHNQYSEEAGDYVCAPDEMEIMRTNSEHSITTERSHTAFLRRAPPQLPKITTTLYEDDESIHAGDVRWCGRRHRWEQGRMMSRDETIDTPMIALSQMDDRAERGSLAEPESPLDIEKQYFAKPGGAGVLRPPKDDGEDPAAFFHPATKESQPIVWLPRDELGIGADEARRNVAAGVASTTRNAVLDHGKVCVVGPAPDFIVL